MDLVNLDLARVWARVRWQMHLQLNLQVQAQVQGLVGEPLWELVQNQVWGHVRQQALEQTLGRSREALT